MKPSSVITDEVIEVPLDLTIDVFTIVLKESIPHKVIRVLSDQSKLILQLRINHKSTLQKGALENIKSFMNEYHIWRSDENEELDWRN